MDELALESSFDPQTKEGDGWRHATITYGKIMLEKRSFWIERSNQEERVPKTVA